MLYEAQPWEKRQQGEDTIERTAAVGRFALNYRRRRDLSDASTKDRRSHVRFIHRLGQDVLSTLPRNKGSTILPQEISNDDLQQSELASLKREQELTEKLLENLDTEKLLSCFDDIDDTDMVSALVRNASKWSNEAMESACAYLLSLFRSTSDERRMQRAEILLSEFFTRHRFVTHILQQQLHYLIHQSTHQLLYQGKCTCQLELLRVLKFIAIKFPKQMTEFKFCYRFSSLLMMDLHLAASVIQLTFRKRNFSKYYQMYDRSQKLQDEFLSGKEAKELFEGQYAMKLRSALRIWRPI